MIPAGTREITSLTNWDTGLRVLPQNFDRRSQKPIMSFQRAFTHLA
jgi:hypothetical protein